jgi:hypothetical protein
LLCKKGITVTKSNEVKTGWSNSTEKPGRILRRRLWRRKDCLANDEDEYGVGCKQFTIPAGFEII